MAKAITSGIAGSTLRAGAPRPTSAGFRLLLVGFTAVIGLTGCAGTPSSPTVPSAPPSATPTTTASPTPAPSAKPALSATPAPSLAFVATGSMHTAREGATATLLKNGKVLIAGGDVYPASSWTIYASAELYDPATGKFTMTGSMTAARAQATAVLLSDGRVLIAGGQGCSDPRHCTNIQPGAEEDLVSADIYDPTTGKFTRTGSMTDVTNSPAAALLPNGKVLIAAFEPGAELYDPATGKFTRLGKGVSTSPPNTATLLADGSVLVITGDGSPQLYDGVSGKLTTISLSLPNVYTATLLKNGRVLLFYGGFLETYDPATGTTSDAGFISPRGQWIYPRATLLPDGRVLFEGGVLSDAGAQTGTSTDVAVLYDPSSRQVSTGSMHAARAGQTATLLSDGSILVAGGGDEYHSNALASAELFRP